MSANLRTQPLLVRVGVLALTLVILGGLAASNAFLYVHYEKRDERPGLSTDDIRAAYHGLKTTAPLLLSLRSGHPETLEPPRRAALVAWLEGGKMEDYDNLDLGDRAPVEIFASSCISCHARVAAPKEPLAARIPLEFFDDVKKLAVSRTVQPMDIKILLISTHTHSLSMAALAAVMAGLALWTTWPRKLLAALCAGVGLGLLIDLSSWWLTRWNGSFVYAIVAGGGLFNAAMVAMALLVIVETLRPGLPAATSK